MEPSSEFWKALLTGLALENKEPPRFWAVLFKVLFGLACVFSFQQC
jgi:hypothetical protein